MIMEVAGRGLSETRTHETKFVFNNSSVKKILKWLNSRCFSDTVFPASIVSSIYYDTPSKRYLGEKINSDFFKKKIRLRWYSDLKTGKSEAKSYFETKYKIGNKREKIRYETDFTGDFLSKVNLNDLALKNIPRLCLSDDSAISDPVFPIFDIIYKRVRFVEPILGLRLCVDYDIGVSRVNWQILPGIPPFWLRTAVFELKGTSQDMPQILHQLTAMGCRKQSFSKYMVCYKKIIREID
jgi:hypothetical protein